MRMSNLRQPQTGSTLIVVMIMLIIITLLGLSASQMSLMGEKTSRFDRDYQIALQAAEAALLDAEFDIRGPNTSAKNRTAVFAPGNRMPFVTGCNAETNLRGLCAPAAENEKQIWYTVDFLDESSSAQTVALGEFTGRPFQTGQGIMPARLPRYIIEASEDKSFVGHEAGGPPTKIPMLYRITAIGFGPRVETQVVLQSVFRKE